MTDSIYRLQDPISKRLMTSAILAVTYRRNGRMAAVKRTSSFKVYIEKSSAVFRKMKKYG